MRRSIFPAHGSQNLWLFSMFLGGTGSYIQVHINMNREKVIALVHLQEKSVPNGIDFSDKYTKIVKTKW